MNEEFVMIPESVTPVSVPEIYNLELKRWDALRWIGRNTFARATRMRLLANMKRRTHKVVRFPAAARVRE